MTNDELALELGSVKTMLAGLISRFDRMEKAVESIVPIDKAVAAQAIKFETVQEDIRDLWHEAKNIRQQVTSSAELTGKRIEVLETDRNKVLGSIAFMKLFSGVMGFFLTASAGWLYARAEMNRDMNLRQEMQIEQIEKQLKALNKDVKRLD